MTVLREVATELATAGVPSPDSDAAALLAHAWGRSVSDVHRAHVLGERPGDDVLARLRDLVAARLDRVPLQHLTGTAPFRSLELAVGPGVFIPRPETEMMVDLALSDLPSGATVVDLCTGSGALAIALALERPDTNVFAVEVDPHAHAWAQRNVEALSAAVDLRLGDAREAFPELCGQVDVVVSNPPYIPIGMLPTEPEVRDHDPAIALYGGSEDGLFIPLAVARRAADLLRSGGSLVMEHADVQGADLIARLSADGWDRVTDHHDLTQKPRTVVARRR